MISVNGIIIIIISYYYFLFLLFLLIQDSGGSAGTDDPTSQYKGKSPQSMKIISDKRDLRVGQLLRTNMNFQIAVALACVLDIRISFIYTSSCICLGTKL